MQLQKVANAIHYMVIVRMCKTISDMGVLVSAMRIVNYLTS